MIPRDSFRYEGTESHGPGLDVPSPRSLQLLAAPACEFTECIIQCMGYITVRSRARLRNPVQRPPRSSYEPQSKGLGRLQSPLSLPQLACASASPKPEQWWSHLNQRAHVQTPSNRSRTGFSHHERLYLLEEILLPSPMTVASMGWSAVAHDGLASTRKHASWPTGLAVGGCPSASSCPENSRQRRKSDGGDWS